MSTLWEKYGELARAKDAVRKIRADIRALEIESARAKLKRLSPHQAVVLNALAGMYEGEWHEWRYYCGYSSMCEASGLNRRQVRRALLGLRRLGFAEYARALSTEDGEFAGAGWRISRAGYAYCAEHSDRSNEATARTTEAA